MKRILTLVLTAAIFASSCSIAFAQETSSDILSDNSAPAGQGYIEDLIGASEGSNDDREALLCEYGDVLSSVYPQLISYDDMQANVTRRDFLVMLTNLTAGMDYPVYHGFADVNPSDTALCSALGFAVETGLVSVSDTFRPDDYISYPEMFKMAVVTAGYDMLAKQSGGWPSGYAALADRTNLNENISCTDGTVTAADAYILLFNVITVNFMEQTSFGITEEYTVAQGKTILESRYGVQVIEGIVNADSITGLTDASAANAGNEITIGTQTFYNTTSNSYLGFNVRGYWRKNGAVREIIALRKLDNTDVFVSEFKMKGTYTLENTLPDGKTKNYSLCKSYMILLNDVASPYVDLADYEARSDVTLHIIDNNNDRLYDVVKIYEWKHMQIGKIDAVNMLLFDDNPATSVLDLHKDNSISEIYSFENGSLKKIEFSDLEADDVITYIISSNPNAATLFRSSVKFTGKLDEFNSDDNTILMAGQSYELTPYATQNFGNFTLGANVTVAIDATGRAVSIIQTASDWQYAYIVASGSNDVFGSDYKVKLFTQSAKMEIFDLADKVYVDDTPKSPKEFYDIEQALGDADRMMKFSLNSEGKINAVDFAVAASADLPFTESNPERNSLTLYYNDTYEKGAKGTFGTAFVADGSTLIFQIPESQEFKNSEEYYMIKSYSSYRNGYMHVRAYDIEPGKAPKAMLVLRDDRVPAIDAYSGAELLLEITDGLNADGEVCKLMKTYGTSGSNTYYVDNSVDTSSFVPGDLLAISVYQNVILNATVHYSYSTNQLNWVSDDKLSYQKGYIYAYGDSVMQLWNTLNINNSVSINDLTSIVFTDKNITFVDIYKNSEGTIYKAMARYKPVTEVKDYLHAGTDADFMLVRNGTNKWIYRIIER